MPGKTEIKKGPKNCLARGYYSSPITERIFVTQSLACAAERGLSFELVLLLHTCVCVPSRGLSTGVVLRPSQNPAVLALRTIKASAQSSQVLDKSQ